MQSKMDAALSGEVKDTIRYALKELKENTPGFRDRASQRKLIAEVARSLSGFYGDHRVLVVEAPTGTGKSIGYMIGGIPVAIEKDKRVVISTGTVALQEQLINRDIPSLQERSGLDFSYVLAKGRSRYACNRNIAELTNSDARQTTLLENDSALDSASWPFLPSDKQVKLVMDMEKKLTSKLWNGDLDEWSGSKIDDEIRMLVVTDNGSCHGRSCPDFYRCGYQNSRATLKEANVIVANHDLVMSDFQLGGGVILPDPTDTFFIFDEAHHLPDVALAHGASESSIRGSLDLVSKTPRILAEGLSALKEQPVDAKGLINKVRDSTLNLAEALKSAETYIAANFPEQSGYMGRKPAKGSPITWRFEDGAPPEGTHDLAKNILAPAEFIYNAVNRQLENMREAFKEKKIDQNLATKAGKSLSFHRGRLEKLIKTWQMMIQEDQPGTPPTARWVTHQPKAKGKREDYIVSCSPTSAAEDLRKLWGKAAGVVFASATVTALGNFNRFAERAGLGFRDGTQYLQLPSPFNHQNGELHIPFMRTDPSSPAEHTAEITQFMNNGIQLEQGTLVLFTSRKQMMEVAEKVRPALRDILLVQGELSKNQILQEHEKKITAGEGSVIFGLASFSEGVDLPGKLCEHVVITKLPFSVPDNPIDATYSEWLKSIGRNPFMELSVPDACTKLVQACGRLIRSETDTGRVTLLDRRILTKRYGGQMLNSLPPFTRRIDMVDQDAQTA